MTETTRSPISAGNRPVGERLFEPPDRRGSHFHAVLIGGISGFIGGKFDLVMQRLVDAWMAFPGLLLFLTIMSIVGKGLLQIIVVLGIAGGIGGSRVVRGAVIGVKENDYFLATRAVGTPTTQILLRHVLPNIMAPVIIIFSINIGGVIISEASLSFLGFGLPAQIPIVS